jgi:hypothetical protein
VVEGTELLAHIFHPERFSWDGPDAAFLKVDLDLLRGSFAEKRDYYYDGEAIVFTASYLQRRGYCCGSGCRHCPYQLTLRATADKFADARVASSD